MNNICTLNEAINDNNNLIYSICSKYTNYCDKEDLYQQGVIGLINAYNNYDNTKNTKFSTYAFPYIVGEVSNYVRENKNIKISRDIIRLGKKINEYIDKHKSVRGYEPSIEDISKMLNISTQKVIYALDACKNIKSIDEKINDEGKEITLLDKLVKEDIVTTDTILDLKEAFKYLSDTEKELLINRYYKDLTQSEVSKILGVNQVYVSRLEKKALSKMKDRMYS